MPDTSATKTFDSDFRAPRTCIAVLGLLLLTLPERCDASYGFYIGKNCTADGSVILGGYGDEPSSHWLEIIPRRKHPPGTMITVGVTGAARLPGELIEIPQVPETARYITMNYSSYAGFPAPLTNGGLNEYGVAARDIWCTSRDALVRMTPNPQRGPQYSDLARIAMERARTAREAVEIIGALINEYGYSTYGGNSHLFADQNEGWIFINFAGGKKLWAAQRLGPDDIRVSRPGYIEEFPLDFQNHPDFMGSPNLISFAVEQGWYDPKSGEPFHVNKVYTAYPEKSPDVAAIEAMLRERKGNLTLKDAMNAVRLPRLIADSAGYGQVAHLRGGLHPELATLWVSATGAFTAPLIPYRIGVSDVPPEFQWHRYLTEGESSKYAMDVEFRGIESTRYAFRVFKRLFYLTEEHREKFLPEVTEALEAFEARLRSEQPDVEATAQTLFESGRPELARKYLTFYSQTEALNGLRLGEALADSLEARTKAIYGIRAPTPK